MGKNSNFEKFLQDVTIDFNGKKLHRSEYDEVVKEYWSHGLHGFW